MTTQDLDEFTAYFESLGIPLAAVQAPMVASIELVGGALLVIGLATRFAALPLAGTMVVAILTARLNEAGVDSVGDFLYLPEWLLLLLLAWLATNGAGRFSVDHRVAAKLDR